VCKGNAPINPKCEGLGPLIEAECASRDWNPYKSKDITMRDTHFPAAPGPCQFKECSTRKIFGGRLMKFTQVGG